jgi:hypothetical protein
LANVVELSRRAVLTGAAVVAVAGRPAIGAGNPDAELVALGKHIDEISAIYDDARKRSQPNWAAFSRELKKLDETRTGPIADEVFEEAMARVGREFPIAFPTCDDVMDASSEPSERIVALRAVGIDGLAAKAKLAKFTCPGFWKEPDDRADWDHRVLRNLIDAVLQLSEAVQS